MSNWLELMFPSLVMIIFFILFFGFLALMRYLR